MKFYYDRKKAANGQRKCYVLVHCTLLVWAATMATEVMWRKMKKGIKKKWQHCKIESKWKSLGAFQFANKHTHCDQMGWAKKCI